MRKQPDQFSNSNARRAFISRSTNHGRVFDGASGCLRLWHSMVGLRPHRNLEHSVVRLCIRVISSGYRGFASVLQNSPSRVSDVFQIITPRSISFQALHELKLNVEFFRDVRKSFRGSRNA